VQQRFLLGKDLRMRCPWLVVSFVMCAPLAFAQDDDPLDEAVPSAGMPADDPEMQRMHDMAEHMVGPAGVTRARRGSGTSWLPDSAPMRGWMVPLGKGGLMVHGNAFVAYDWFSSARGDGSFISTNDVGAMAWYPLGPLELSASAMLSAEPLTVGTAGYPLIFQTGETAYGEPLHDRQHPHDLFMELALNADMMFTQGFGLEVYVAPAGEPALGPPAFMHRPSAMSDPLAPIGHHWLDSTHISFGVVTVGLFSKAVKVEGSWFNGREPDEVRYDLDLRVPDSWSARATVNLADNWSLQASYGFLKSPEAEDPVNSLQRITTSVLYNHPIPGGGNFAVTLAYGENIPTYGLATHSVMQETTCDLNAHNTVFQRIEYGMRTGKDLAVGDSNERVGFHLAVIDLGYVRYFGPWGGVSPGVGVRGEIGFMGADLGRFYGTQVPVGATLFVQFRPEAMSSGGEHEHMMQMPMASRR
jgi:hypothetical protein